MLRLASAAALALSFAALSTPDPAAQADDDFQPLRTWDAAAGTARVRASDDSLVLDAGRIHSQTIYADVVFRFDYRLATAAARGSLFTRGSFDAAGRLRGYTVALDTGTGRGQLGAAHHVLHEERYDPPAAPVAPGRWVACEMRVEGDRLTVSLDGVLVAIADRLDARSGFLGFTASDAGGLELRNMRVAPLPATTGPFERTVSAESPGVTKPTLLRSTSPMYPPEMMRQRITGTVYLEVVIDAEGRITHSRVRRTPHPDLGVAAMACVRQWRFGPATKDGAPIPVVATVDVSFTLEGPPRPPKAG